MRRFWYCDNQTQSVDMFENFDDVCPVPTAMGPRQADSLVGSSKATAHVPGINTDGGVTYTARHGGARGNEIRVTHENEPQGQGAENRSLTAGRVGFEITVTFATDGAGDAIVPVSLTVANLINTDPDISKYIVASEEGAGGGLVNLAPGLPLMGGADNGDWRKFSGPSGKCRQINTVEVV